MNRGLFGLLASLGAGLFALSGCSSDSNSNGQVIYPDGGVDADASSSQDAAPDSPTADADASPQDGEAGACQSPQDCPGTDSTCAMRSCTAGTCGFNYATTATSCTDNGGKVCDGQGACVECNSGADCATGQCSEHQCQGCVDEIAIGRTHTCARKSSGTLWCWGENHYGQLGNGQPDWSVPTPVQATALGTSANLVAGGDQHTCSIRADKSLWCWGDNEQGQVGIGNTTSPQATPQQLSSLGTQVDQVVGGGRHTCARLHDGSVWCWGANDQGQLGIGSLEQQTGPTQVTALAHDAVDISAGVNHSCAVKIDGTAWCWGQNDQGQLGIGNTDSPKNAPVQVSELSSNVLSMSAGTSHSCALKADHTVWCWGKNDQGQLGIGNIDTPKLTPIAVTGLTGEISQISAGDTHSCAVKADKTLWCWGANRSGQLGLGSMTDPILTAQQVSSLGNSVDRVLANHLFTCVHTVSKNLWCWGNDEQAQLGDGTASAPTTSPFKVPLSCP